MKSEAVGDKVPVMTGKHAAIVTAIVDEQARICEHRASLYPGSYYAERGQLFREIEANLRSQVESGLSGRFNPETHVAVERGIVRRALKVLGKVRNFAFPLPPRTAAKLEREIKETFDALNKYASPSPETPEHPQ